MESYQVNTPFRAATRGPVKVMHLVNIDSGVIYTPLCHSCDAGLSVWVDQGFIRAVSVRHEGTCTWWIAGVVTASAEMAEFWASIMDDTFVPTAPPLPEWATSAPDLPEWARPSA